MRPAVRVLLVLLLVAAIVAVAVWFNVLAVARQGAVLAWRWSLPVLGPLLRLYAWRRAMAPLSALLTRALLVALAVFGLQRIARRSGMKLQAWLGLAIARWKELPPLLRWLIASVTLFLAAFLSVGLILVPIWLPFMGRWARSLHFWWIDKVGQRWLRPMRRRIRYTVRHNWLLRTIRRPYRILVYYLVTRTDRGSQLAKRHMHQLWQRLDRGADDEPKAEPRQPPATDAVPTDQGHFSPRPRAGSESVTCRRRIVTKLPSKPL